MKNGRTGWRLEGAGLWARRGKVVGGATLLRPRIVFDEWTMGALLLGNVVSQSGYGDSVRTEMISTRLGCCHIWLCSIVVVGALCRVFVFFCLLRVGGFV